MKTKGTGIRGVRTPQGQANLVAAVTKHGHAAGEKQTPEYRAWADMKNRCENQKIRNYKRYGGRGIAVCERWANSFENFLADMGARPTKLHSLERKNNDLGYSPENCRWATKLEQCNNTARNVFIEYGGVRKTLAEWARELGLTREQIYARRRYGWSDEQIIEGRSPSGKKLPKRN